MVWCGHFYGGDYCDRCNDIAREEYERRHRDREVVAARERAAAEQEALRWRVDPWGGEAMCIPPAFYGWEERDGIRHWVTTAVWVADRLGQRCAEVDALRCIVGEDG